MNKQEIFNELKKLNINKDDYIVISGASLVVQGIIDSTNDIDLSTTTKVYESLDWNEKLGHLAVNIKYKDKFEISNHLFEPIRVVNINGYNFANLEEVLDVKILCNREKDKEIIKKLTNILNNRNINNQQN